MAIGDETTCRFCNAAILVDEAVETPDGEHCCVLCQFDDSGTEIGRLREENRKMREATDAMVDFATVCQRLRNGEFDTARPAAEVFEELGWDMPEEDYGIDLGAGNCGWFLHVRGWRQLVMLLLGLLASYALGAWMW